MKRKKREIKERKRERKKERKEGKEKGREKRRKEVRKGKKKKSYHDDTSGNPRRSRFERLMKKGAPGGRVVDGNFLWIYLYTTT